MIRDRCGIDRGHLGTQANLGFAHEFRRMTIPIIGQRRAEIRLVILIVAVAATAAGLYRHRILNHDEGFTLNGAWKIFNGQEIYTDFHTYVPPGSYNFVAWLFDIFGPHYWTAKLGAVAFLCLSALALYRMTRLLNMPYLACLLVAVIWIQLGGLAHIVNHNNLSAFAAVFAVAAFVEAVLKKRMALFLIAGLLLSLTITMHQFKGGFLTVFLLSAAVLPGSARLLEFRQEYEDDRNLAISTMFPNASFQQLNNSLATRQIQTKGIDAFDLVWTYFGYADDDDDMTDHRLRQLNLFGPGGLVSMEDAEAIEIAHRASRNEETDATTVIEVGGKGEISDRAYRVNDVPIRGFWSYYAELMGIEPEGAVR